MSRSSSQANRVGSGKPGASEMRSGAGRPRGRPPCGSPTPACARAARETGGWIGHALLQRADVVRRRRPTGGRSCAGMPRAAVQRDVRAERGEADVLEDQAAHQQRASCSGKHGQPDERHERDQRRRPTSASADANVAATTIASTTRNTPPSSRNSARMKRRDRAQRVGHAELPTAIAICSSR